VRELPVGATSIQNPGRPQTVGRGSAFKLGLVSVNPEVQGRSYPATAPYLVGREKVREFARAVLATSPLHFDEAAARAAGYSDVVAPPTFPIVVQDATLQQLLADPDAGIDFSRVVHGDQRFSYSRPIVAGDELTGTMTVTSVKALAGNSMITSETVIADATGAHVVTATSSLVVRSAE
jgi:acyl dehydratase